MEDTPEFAQMNGFLFPFIGSLLFVAIHIMIYFLLVRHISTRHYLCRFYSAILWINLGWSVAYMFMRYTATPKWLFMLASVSVGVAFSFLIAALVAGAVNGFLILFRHHHLAPRIKRYILALSCLYTIYAVYHGLADPKIEKLSMELEKLTAPLSIVQLSDVHIGGLMDEERVAKIIFLVNQTNPDIIAITGDLVDTSLANAESSLELLKALRAKYGVYYVLGNHEYIHDVFDMLDRLKNLGIKVLINEQITISDSTASNTTTPLINLAGSADLMGNRLGFLKPDFEKTLENLNPALPTILLTHQPKVIDILPESLLSRVDLMLTGHTHGGQIFPISLAVLLQQPYLKGLHRTKTGGYVYVSEGTGFWGPPMRALSDSEITLFELLPPASHKAAPEPIAHPN